MENTDRDDLFFLFQRLRSLFMVKERSDKYLRFIRQQECIRCKAIGTEPHHVFGSMGSLKSSDLETIPLCRPCHQFITDNPKENKNCLEWLMITQHNYIKLTLGL